MVRKYGLAGNCGDYSCDANGLQSKVANACSRALFYFLFDI